MYNSFFKEELRNYFLVILGSIFLALGVVWFFISNHIITGGTAGLSLLLYYITSFSVGTWMVLVNIPLLFIGIKYLGKMFAIRTVFCIIFTSIMIDFLQKVLKIEAFVNDTILGAIFGGIFIGVGLALVIKGNASAGGSTIIARIVSSKTEIKPSQVILFIDSMIILSSLFIFDDTQKVLWSIVSIYVSVLTIDKILTGNLNKKVIHLVTSKPEEFAVLIREKIGPHGTIISGDGLYKEEKKMILIVIEVTKLQLLRQLVKAHDEEAFLIISEANEMLGRDY